MFEKKYVELLAQAQAEFLAGRRVVIGSYYGDHVAEDISEFDPDDFGREDTVDLDELEDGSLYVFFGWDE